MSTLVSKWLASIGIDPSLLIDANLMIFDQTISNFPNSSKVIMGVQEGVVIKTEVATEARVLSMTEKETLDALKRLKSCFPYSLNGNTLLTNIFWEYATVWKSNVADLRLLNSALDVGDQIPCPHTRQS